MSSVLFIVIYSLFLLFFIIMGVKEIKMNYFNPLPKLDNGIDKSDNNIRFFKTRVIK